jgi:hypothetical protein
MRLVPCPARLSDETVALNAVRAPAWLASHLPTVVVQLPRLQAPEYLPTSLTGCRCLMAVATLNHICQPL